jgi:hypothetical protein
MYSTVRNAKLLAFTATRVGIAVLSRAVAIASITFAQIEAGDATVIYQFFTNLVLVVGLIGFAGYFAPWQISVPSTIILTLAMLQNARYLNTLFDFPRAVEESVLVTMGVSVFAVIIGIYRKSQTHYISQIYDTEKKAQTVLNRIDRAHVQRNTEILQEIKANTDTSLWENAEFNPVNRRVFIGIGSVVMLAHGIGSLFDLSAGRTGVMLRNGILMAVLASIFIVTIVRNKHRLQSLGLMAVAFLLYFMADLPETIGNPALFAEAVLSLMVMSSMVFIMIGMIIPERLIFIIALIVTSYLISLTLVFGSPSLVSGVVVHGGVLLSLSVVLHMHRARVTMMVDKMHKTGQLLESSIDQIA